LPWVVIVVVVVVVVMVVAGGVGGVGASMLSGAEIRYSSRASGIQ
jgi:preprotein translocase subunit SecG